MVDRLGKTILVLLALMLRGLRACGRVGEAGLRRFEEWLTAAGRDVLWRLPAQRKVLSGLSRWVSDARRGGWLDGEPALRPVAVRSTAPPLNHRRSRARRESLPPLRH